MKRLIIEKLILITIFIFFYFIIEVITFEWLGLNFLPNVFFIDFLIVLIISSIALLFKSNRLSVFYLSVLLFTILVISFTNQTMNIELNGEIFSLSYFELVNEATNVFMIDFIHFDALVVLISIAIVFWLTIKYIIKVFFQTYVSNVSYYKQAITLFSIILIVFISLFNTEIPSIRNYGKIFNINLFKRETIEEYGIIGFYYKDIDIMFFDGGIDQADEEDFDDDILFDFQADYGESSLEISYKGLLEGKNIITIMVESGQSFAINEYLTPNLYRLSTEGLFFPNHYSENSTSVSEIIGISGLYSSKGYNVTSYDYNFEYTLTNRLNELGYHTAYFHENSGDFYNRENTMPAFGFDDVYMHEELFPEEPLYGWGGDYTLDSRTMDRMFDFMFKDDEPFYYFWTSLVGHGPYNMNYPSDRGDNNLVKFRKLGYFELIDLAESRGDWVNLLDNSEDEKDPGRFRFYQATMMDFDRAIGKLLTKLEEENLLDDTIILMYGDHKLYYHQMHLSLNNIEEGDIHYTDMYKTMFILYNPLLTNAYLTNSNKLDTTVDKFITPYDILPTYYHLLNIPYNKNFVLGESILSDEATVFYSHKISAFFNNQYFSYNNNSIYYPEDIELFEDSEALDFVLYSQELSEKLVWLDMWTEFSKKNK